MQAGINAGNVISMVMPFMVTVMNFTTLIVIWLGGRMVTWHEMGTGTLVSYLSYLLHIMMSIMVFSMIFIMLARAEACAKRVLEVLNTQIDIRDECRQENKAVKVHAVREGRIEFRDVCFKYAAEGKNVLSRINLSINPGEFVAIVGGTGSGKTTLVSLIPRLYDVTEGQVLVDGIDVRDYALRELTA